MDTVCLWKIMLSQNHVKYNSKFRHFRSMKN
ncbi:hypothetical protein [uncultured Lactobacillus sp.]